MGAWGRLGRACHMQTTRAAVAPQSKQQNEGGPAETDGKSFSPSASLGAPWSPNRDSPRGAHAMLCIRMGPKQKDQSIVFMRAGSRQNPYQRIEPNIADFRGKGGGDETRRAPVGPSDPR